MKAPSNNWLEPPVLLTGAPIRELTFPKDAALTDPARLINASLEGEARRTIDLQHGVLTDEEARRALVVAAVAANPDQPV